MSKSKILILGSSGFIGSRLMTKFNAVLVDFEIVGWSSEKDITKPAIINEIVELKPDYIVIAAGKTFVPDSWNDPLAFFSVNTHGVTNVADAARICSAKIVYLSTFVYGAPYELPISEKNPIEPFNPYASSKYLAEKILQDYGRHFGVETNVLRVFNVYGRGQRSDFLVPMLIQQFKSSDKIQVKDLSPKRDYVNVDDLVDAILAAVKKFEGFQIFNVAGGKSYSVQEVIDLIFKAGGRTLKVQSENTVRLNEVNDTLADISKIKRDLNWEPKISMEDGLRDLL
jgi:nucleoside-diphosphate-sugar epimerase